MPCPFGAPVVLLASAIAQGPEASGPDTADDSIAQFLMRDGTQRSYRATRRLDAETGRRSGWLETATEYSHQLGFSYAVTAEGGSAYIRSKVLRALLEAERDVIARGEARRSALVQENYTFRANGVDADGLASILLTPRRKERVLVSGTMFLQPGDGRLVRLEGRLAKSPSFWVKNVDIVRSYESIGDAVVPVALTSRAHVRLLGSAELRMTYSYSDIDGRPVARRP